MASNNKAHIHFVTYNILSSKLCKESHYPHQNPADLNPHTRYARVLEKLESRIQEDAVIALQEVSESWAGKLAVFFQHHEYFFVKRLYAGPFSDYMGVGLAFPKYKFKLIDLEMKRISDTTDKWPENKKKNTRKGPENQNNKNKNKIGPFARAPLTAHEIAKKRFNTGIWSQLECKDTGKQFCISTYHMPCAFKTPLVMNIHVSLALKYFQDKSGNLPLIFGGDFNMKPGDFPYKIVTSGIIDKSSLELLSGEPTKVMNSAYKQFIGKEPDYTNYSWSESKPEEPNEPFIDCLDYIFISDHFDVVDVLELGDRSESSGPFPNATEPSDHLMLGSTLAL